MSKIGARRRVIVAHTLINATLPLLSTTNLLLECLLSWLEVLSRRVIDMSACLAAFRTHHLLEDEQQDINTQRLKRTTAAIQIKNLPQRMSGASRIPSHHRESETSYGVLCSIQMQKTRKPIASRKSSLQGTMRYVVQTTNPASSRFGLLEATMAD